MYWLNESLGDRFEEHWLAKNLASISSVDDVIWDIGANAGLLSYRLATTAKFKTLVFFEPNKMMHTLASEALAQFPNVQGLRFALSDKSGTSTLVIPEGASAVGTMEPVRTDRVGSTMQIEARLGDELVEQGIAPAPSIIKIDTEGHELSVLQGLARTIATLRPKILLEHLSLTDAELFGAVPAGYQIFTEDEHTGALIPGFDRARGHNSALIPE